MSNPVQNTTDDLDEIVCPCGGPPCQIPGHGCCGAKTKREWLAEHADDGAEDWRDGDDLASGKD